MPQLIAAAAEETPNAVAVLHGSLQLTYAELNTRANRLAAHLQSLGVETEIPVGLCLERSFDYIIAALAVWKAGGAYLPLDPAWPEERRALVLEDAQAPVLITRGALAAKARYIVDLDRPSPDILSENATPAAIPTKRDHLAYIIYTSGSTGQPKGVEVTHGNLLNLAFWHRRAFGVTAADRASHIAGLAFDAAAWELWPHLSAGASIAIPDEITRASPELLRDWLLSERVTISFVPTALAEPMLESAWPRTAALRYLLTGADMLHRFPPSSLPFALVNNYGPTECTVVATSGIVPPSEDITVSPSIGSSIAHTEIHLLDENLQPVKPGETGEICIGGSSVARGYRNRPDLTGERFIPNPFSDVAGARLYRTGDFGAALPNGQIAFRGRLDHQEKIRGHRIEPDEIVTAIHRHLGVAQSAVSTFGDACNKQLVAYIKPAKGSLLTAHELREFLTRHLPSYMIPSAFVRLDSLPLNANGKLDRAALPPPSAKNALDTMPYRAPQSPVEIRMAAILGELLNVRCVGLDDNFFLLGGHSLLGTQLILRAREIFGVELTLRHLFEAQTVAKLSAEIERQLILQINQMSDEEANQLLQAYGERN